MPPQPQSLQPSSLLPSAAMHARHKLDVMEFAAERADDIRAVCQLLAPRRTGPTGIEPPERLRRRLLRRRTNSTTVWRWHTRRPVPANLVDKVRGRSRRDRRRPSTLRERAAARGGLETEAWHAKRFSMVTMWGVRLPWRARDRGDRAALRATNRTVTLHDASYLRPLEVRGEAAALHGVLAAVLDVPADAVGRLLRGGRELETTLHWAGRQPAAAIAPVRLLPCGAPAHAARGVRCCVRVRRARSWGCCSSWLSGTSTACHCRLWC